jgi:hypothetical protein
MNPINLTNCNAGGGPAPTGGVRNVRANKRQK